MHRKRKNISQCKAEAPDNKKRWCKPCQYKRGANQCEGPVPETTPTPALNPQRSSTVPFPKICGGCGVICCGVPMCFDCMRKGPTIPEPTIPEPTAVVPTCPAPTTPVLTSSSGRTITSPVPFQFSEKQVHPVRFSMHACVHASFRYADSGSSILHEHRGQTAYDRRDKPISLARTFFFAVPATDSTIGPTAHDHHQRGLRTAAIAGRVHQGGRRGGRAVVSKCEGTCCAAQHARGAGGAKTSRGEMWCASSRWPAF